MISHLSAPVCAEIREWLTCGDTWRNDSLDCYSAKTWQMPINIQQ